MATTTNYEELAEARYKMRAELEATVLRRYGEGATYALIAREVGLSVSRVYSIISGYDMVGARERKDGEFEDKEALIADYNGDMPVDEICQKYSIAPPRMYQILDHAHVQRRNRRGRRTAVSVVLFQCPSCDAVLQHVAGVGLVCAKERKIVVYERQAEIRGAGEGPAGTAEEATGEEVVRGADGAG